MGVWCRYRFDGHSEEGLRLTEAYHIVCLRYLDVPRMTFALLCRSLPGFARCLGEYYRLSMRLPAIKSEKSRFDEVRLTFRLDDSRHQGRFV